MGEACPMDPLKTLLSTINQACKTQKFELNATVLAVRPRPNINRVFFDVLWNGIRVECVATLSSVREGDTLVLVGEFYVDKQLRLQFNARQISRDTAVSAQPTQIARMRPAVALPRFIDHLKATSVGYVCALSSDIGRSDFLGEVGMQDAQRVRFSSGIADRAQVLSFLAESNEAPDCLGVLLLRGGGPDISLVWNDAEVASQLAHFGKPIYAGLGHQPDHHEADRLVDQSFPTPGGLGRAWRDAMHQARTPEPVPESATKPIFPGFADTLDFSFIPKRVRVAIGSILIVLVLLCLRSCWH